MRKTKAKRNFPAHRGGAVTRHPSLDIDDLPRPGIGHNRPPPDDPLAGRLTIRPKELWPLLGIDDNTGYRMIKDGTLRVTRSGNVTLVHVDSVREFLASEGEPVKVPPRLRGSKPKHAEHPTIRR